MVPCSKVVRLDVVVERVDVVVKVSRRVPRIGVQNHATVGAFKHHFPEWNVLKYFLSYIAKNKLKSS